MFKNHKKSVYEDNWSKLGKNLDFSKATKIFFWKSQMSKKGCLNFCKKRKLFNFIDILNAIISKKAGQQP